MTMIREAQPTDNSYVYRQQVLNQLRTWLPYESACFTLVDPDSLLSIGAVTDDRIERMHDRLFANEYLTEDFNRYEALTKSANPVASLHLATEGNLGCSRRFREILEPAGFGDELRAVLMHQGKCWGFLTLFRSTDQALFSSHELEQLSVQLPAIAQSLHAFTLAAPSSGSHMPTLEAAILIVDENLELISFNRTAEALLQWLREQENIGPAILPRPIRAICSQAQAETEGVHSPHNMLSNARVGLRAPDGTYLTLQASRLSAESPQYAIISKRANPREVLTQLLDSYGLTLREQQLVRLLLHGDSTKQIAESLCISVYTVQDHLKSIFAKTAVSSRRELVGLLLASYSLPYSVP